jgi:Domain of unknown function (DUF3291)
LVLRWLRRRLVRVFGQWLPQWAIRWGRCGWVRRFARLPSRGVIVNLTTWASVEDLASFVFGAVHTPIMRRRRQWFAKVAVATTALWWVPAGHRPTTGEAEDRLRHLRLHGPTSYAFTLRQSWTAPDATRATGEPNVNEAWFCPT